MLAIHYPKITDADDLRKALQNAIRLEHATIPPYLVAYWTLSGTSDSVAAARRILRDIFIDEMYHMLTACNLLNAVGGSPAINLPGFVPTYPGPLPMTIGSGSKPFTVGLRRYARATVENTFMKIEEPEAPIDIPVKADLVARISDHYDTIGEFYSAIATTIRDGGNSLFTGSGALQIVYGRVEAITNVDSALAALQTVVQQGEGTPQSPLGGPNIFAHYYRFQSLALGFALSTDSQGKAFFDRSKPIAVDDVADVIAMADDPGQVDLSGDPAAAQLADAFDATYRKLLDMLHGTVNGAPQNIDAAMDVMTGDLSDAADALLKHQITGGKMAGQYAGPRFMP